MPLAYFGDSNEAVLDGQPVSEVRTDLTAGNGETMLNLTQAKPLAENAGACIRGIAKVGRFDVPGEMARLWLAQSNPNSRPGSDVLTPWANGMDVTRRSSDTWLINFGALAETDARLYEAPFAHVLANVRSERLAQRDPKRREFWWRLGRSGAELHSATSLIPRYIATPMVAKHRLFVWMDSHFFADQQLIVIARADDTTFGILHSRFHELWSRRMGTSLADRPRYIPTTTFETFSFPEGMTPRDTASASDRASSTCYADLVSAENIAATVRYLNERREAWLNPPEWVDWVRTTEEEVAGFPLRPMAKSGHEAELKQRTLTKLYNARPAWLDHAHRELDAFVAAAYGWADYSPEMPDEEILRRLLALNLERAEIERQLEIERQRMKERRAVPSKLAE